MSGSSGRCAWLLAAAAMAAATPAAALEVLEPDGAGDPAVQAGFDFASQTIGDPWDMANAGDVQTRESQNLADQTIAGSIYSAEATSNDPYFYLLYNGVPTSVPLHNGFRYPITTADYRYLTVKLRATSNGSPIPPAQAALQAFFYRDQNSFVDFVGGCSVFAYYTPGPEWQVVTIDLTTFQPCGALSTPWHSLERVEGFRIDPVAAPGARVEIDWVRLTSAAVTPQQRFEVRWTDSQAGSYTITAIDAAGARAVLATGVTGTSHQADLSRLVPGDYRIEVSRAGATALSPAALHINHPPQLAITRPDERGDQSRNYALVERGNPWGPMDPSDILMAFNVTNVSYTNPPGSLVARPTSNDPYLFFDAPVPIDTELYRSACFTMQIFGPRDVGAGSVARIFWGALSSVMTNTDDIVIDEGLNERCIADLATVPLEGAAAGPWTGVQNYIRLDPHEFAPVPACSSSPSPANCRDFRLDSFVLSPHYEAAPAFRFAWQTTDPDHAGQTVRVYLDPDRNPRNGNEIAVGSVSRPTGAGTYDWANDAVPPGRYNVYVEADDGINTVGTYATGPLRVSAVGDLIFANGFEG